MDWELDVRDFYRWKVTERTGEDGQVGWGWGVLKEKWRWWWSDEGTGLVGGQRVTGSPSLRWKGWV